MGIGGPGAIKGCPDKWIFPGCGPVPPSRIRGAIEDVPEPLILLVAGVLESYNPLGFQYLLIIIGLLLQEGKGRVFETGQGHEQNKDKKDQYRQYHPEGPLDTPPSGWVIGLKDL
jgi:hypothetical protein